MSAAVQAIGAENDGGAQAYALLVFQLANAVVAVIGRGVCHSRSFDGSVPFARLATLSGADALPAWASLLRKRGFGGGLLLGQALLARLFSNADFTTCRARAETMTQQKHRTYVR